MRKWWRRLVAAADRERLEREMDEELRFHMEMEAEELERAGHTPAEARRRALVAFGGVDRTKEAARDVRGLGRLDEVRQDVRQALRMLRLNPGFTVVGLLTLALGVGATTAIFSLVHGALLRPLPYAEPDRIVTLAERWPDGERGAVADENFRDWRELSRSFEAMAFHWNPAFVPPLTVLGGEAPVRAWVTGVSGGFFEVFGVAPLRGRVFAAEEQQLGGPAAAVVSHSFWRSHLGGDEAVLERSIEVDGEARPIIGVMPAGFHYPGDTDVWLALERHPPIVYRTAKNYAAVGRLRAGVTAAGAQAELDRLGERLKERHGRNFRM
jgi:putative ABC transport system permease protein